MLLAVLAGGSTNSCVYISVAIRCLSSVLAQKTSLFANSALVRLYCHILYAFYLSQIRMWIVDCLIYGARSLLQLPNTQRYVRNSIIHDIHHPEAL